MTRTNIQGDHLTYLEADNDIVLDRNLPEYAMTANKTDNSRYTAIDKDGELILDKNLPQYSFNANLSAHQEFIQPDSVKYLASKTHSKGVMASISNNRTPIEINREVRLPEPLHPGSFDGKYTARSNERMTTYNPNYTNNKRDIMQKIINAR